MAVYDRRYRPYDGPISPARWRFLVIPRFAYRTVFASKLFLAFYIACFLPVLVASCLIYARHNIEFLEQLQLAVGDVLTFGAAHYFWFTIGQLLASYVVVLILGPALISSDLVNNALPLYLARPIGRWEYVFGKFSVLALLSSGITWVPLLFLWTFQANLEGAGWVGEHWKLVPAIIAASLLWITMTTTMALAISAWVRWRFVARIGLLLVLFVGWGFGKMVNLVLGTKYGDLINILEQIMVVVTALFGLEGPGNLPLPLAATMLVVICGAFLFVLSRKVRAYEVVR